MQIPVLIEPVAGNGYVARAGSPFDWSAEGATQDEALQKLQAVVAAKVAAGARVAAVETPPGANPWLGLVGTLDPNDPATQEFRQAIEDYRREIDAAGGSDT